MILHGALAWGRRWGAAVAAHPLWEGVGGRRA